jgi:rubredoxin
MPDLEGEAMPDWKSKRKYDQAVKAEHNPASPGSVSCPVCDAKRGERCVHVDSGRRRKAPHPERRRKARLLFRQRQRAAARMRGMKAKRWEGVTVRFVCPLCGGDHSRADHDRATDGLLERARQAQREAQR